MANRSCRLTPVSSGPPLLRLATERLTSYYLVEKTEGKQGVSYKLTQMAFDAAGRSFPLSYVVHFWSNGRGVCDCPDYTYRGSRRVCKHIGALEALRARGLL